MTELRFVGGTSLGYGLAWTAVAIAVAVWLYRRQLRSEPRRWLAAALIVLRAVAIAMVVLMLTGPVLHHRQWLPQRGRVLVFVDESQSMQVADTQAAPRLKLRIARSLGWLPADTVVLSPGLPMAKGDQREPGVSANQVSASPRATSAAIESPAALDLKDTRLQAALRKFDQTSRWQRAEALLTDAQRGLLARLAQTHDVELIGLDGLASRTRWTSRRPAAPAASMQAPANSAHTNLSTGLQARVKSDPYLLRPVASDGSGGARTAVVLLSDGRHNRGPSPLDTARQLAPRGIPLYAIGFGSDQPPQDLAVVGSEAPLSVFRDDQVRGKLLIADHMPAARTATIRIEHQGTVLWEQPFNTTGAGVRTVEFSFPVRDLVDRLMGPDNEALRINSLPLSLRARVLPLPGELRQDNNEAMLHFRAMTRRHRLLLIDGRARWELRYLRNLFERDQRWQVTTVMAGPVAEAAELPRGSGEDQFPADRAALFNYDMVVLGDISAELFRSEELQWLKEFVEYRGGGLVLLDGSRRGLKSLAASGAGELVPVKWLNHGADQPEPSGHWQLTKTGQIVPAFRLATEDAANDALWNGLPAAHRAAAVEALQGTETLAEIVGDRGSVPALVLRRLGAGRVLYCGCDETWRWRREVADLHHQRFWMQLAQWLMEEPYAASDSYVSLDVGSVVYEPGDAAEIRVRLRDESGRPLAPARVEALLSRAGHAAMTVALESDAGGTGVFRGRSGPLATGDYELAVRVSGFADDHFRARTRFRVEPALGPELADLSCDEAMLAGMCRATGGQFLREEQAARLVDSLRPLAAQRVVESETVLWQSYWWFVPIIVLLGGEWLLRKRTGLL